MTTIYRLLHDAADDVPGLVVDVAGPVALVQGYSEAWRPRLQHASELLRLAGFDNVRALIRGQQGLPVGDEIRLGPPIPEELTATEDAMAFQMRCADKSLSVGLFPDARVARARLRAMARGQGVLNLFAYAGGFTVAALVGGAAQVDQVDVAQKVASWSARNVAVNGLSPSHCRFVVDDALEFTARAARQGRRYGLVVLDPPTFGRSQKGWHTTGGMADMLADALAVTSDGGRLFFSVNTRTLDVDALWQDVTTAAERVRVQPFLEEVILAGPDFPIHPAHPQLQRFKMVVVRVER